MTTVHDLIARNAHFASHDFDAGLTISPAGNMMIIGCVDPRVDPTRVLGVRHGEAGVIRNVGGRVTPETLRTIAMLGKVGQANAATRPPGTWNLVLLHHTDCGMTDLASFPDLLARYFEIPTEQLADKAVSDPRESIRVDVDTILGTLRGPDFLVSGLVYDVATGSVETIVAETALQVR